MIKRDIIIGIDPDCAKNGIAVLNRSMATIDVDTLRFPALIEKLRQIKEKLDEMGRTVVVIVESSWLISHNWHTGKGQSIGSIAKTGYNVGRNHQVGMLIVEYCQNIGIDVIEQTPLKKCWKAKDGKISHAEIAHFIPGFPKSSNQEIRDSALLAWNEAGFPIKIKVNAKI